MPNLAINDIHIHYEIQGQGEPLLFIHGLGSSTQDWENQVDYFSKSFQVITLDLRGHGKSDKPDMPYTVAMFANDVASFIQAFNFGQKIHVIGHSLGGMVAFQLTLDFPLLVKTLTIVNSAPSITFPSLKLMISFYIRKIIIKLFGMQHLATKIAKNLFPNSQQEALRQTLIQRWCQNDPKAYLNALHAFAGWNVMNRLSEIQCPTLIITADHDYTPVKTKVYYAKLIAQSELVIINDSYHMTIIDQPVAFNKALLDFLNRNKNPA